MPVEDASDRSALLDDFGITVRISPAGGPEDVLAIIDGPDREIDGVATEIGFIEPSKTLLMRTEQLAGLRVSNRIEVLSGAHAGAYIARSVVAEDDGEFTRIDLAES